MKVKILPYLIFFLASLVFAHLSAGPEVDRNGADQEWLSIPKGSVSQIIFEGEGKKTTITKDPGSEHYWVEATQTVKSPEGEKVEADRFLANEKMKEVLDSIHSFRIGRVIGAAKDLKQEDFGFDKPSGSFEVKYGTDQAFKLTLGKRGFQSPDIFVLDESKQSILLLAKQFFAPFERAKVRLALVSPYHFSPDLISEASLNVGDKHMEFVKQGKGDSKSWYARSKLDAPDEAFRNWLEKLLKMRIEGYASAEEKPVIEQMPLKFSVLVKSEKQELDLFSIYEDTRSAPTRYWLRTRHIPLPVLIESSHVSTLLADLSAFMR